MLMTKVVHTVSLTLLATTLRVIAIPIDLGTDVKFPEVIHNVSPFTGAPDIHDIEQNAHMCVFTPTFPLE